MTTPMYITFFRPIKSDNFPALGRDKPALKVNKIMLSPFKSAPPKLEIIALNSGIRRLNDVVNKNIAMHINQKLLEYLCFTAVVEFI